MKCFYCFIFIYCVLIQIASGQQAKKLVQLTGNLGLYGDFYSMISDTIGAVEPRRPDALGRLVVNATINIKGFSLPVSMAIPTGQYGTILPQVPTIPDAPFKNFKSLMKNPLNMVGIAPKYKWAQVLLGSQVPQYSELSVGDLYVFGAGISLTPGKFRFSCFAGSSQLAVEEDTTKNIQGIYARKIYSAKIGFGHEDSTHIYLIGSMMKDDTTSLVIKPVTLMPQTGILSAVDFRINLGKIAYIKGEIAGSAFTRDLRSFELPTFTPALPDGIFTPKISSRLDYASVLSIGANWKKFGIRATGRYYGDGFVPLGYPFMQTDRLEVTVSPRFVLFKNKFQLSGSIGQRVNNLSGIRASTTTQTIGAANLNIQLSERLSLASSYLNFGFRNSIINDTFRVEMVTESWSISPSYNLTTKKCMHNFTLMYSQNTFNDFNVISGALNNNDASNGVFSYTLSVLNAPFSFSTLISFFDNNTSFGRLSTKAMNVSVGYKFFKKKLGTTAGIIIADNKINASSSNFQIMTLIGIKYALSKKINFSLRSSINIFEYGDTMPGISYYESLLRTAITYKL